MTATSGTLRLLIVEEQQSELLLLQSILAETKIAIIIKIAKNEIEFLKHVNRFKPDAIISGDTFSSYSFREELEYLREQQLSIPFILITGVLPDVTAQEYYELGVDDYLTKFNLLQLPDSLYKAIEKHRLKKEHTLSEEIAKLNKDRVQTIFDNNPDSTFELGMKGELIRLNSAARNTLQVRPDNQLRKAKISDFVFPKDNKSVKECLQAVWRGHQKEVSFRVESHKGNIRWLEAKAIPLFDEEKIVSSILLICNDLTDKIETEEKLKKSESNLSSILESVHDSIWSVDNNLILEYFNDGFAKLHKEQFGIKVKAGMSLEELMPESKFSNQQLKWKENYERAFSGETVNTEETIIHKGVSRCFYSTLNPVIVSDEIAGVSVIRKEITELKKAQKEMRESEEQFKILAESSPVGIFRTDSEGDCNYVNKKWCDFSGRTIDEAMGKGWVNSIHPDDRELVNTEWSNSVSQQRDFHLEYRMVRPDGKVNWLIGNATSLKSSETEGVIGYIGTISDVTIMKESSSNILELDSMIRNVQRMAKIAFWESEQTGHPGTWSKEMFDLWEFPFEVFAPRRSKMLERVHPDDQAMLIQGMDEVYLNKQMLLEFRLVFPDGRMKYIVSTGYPVKDPDSLNIKAIGTVIDITALK